MLARMAALPTRSQSCTARFGSFFGSTFLEDSWTEPNSFSCCLLVQDSRARCDYAGVWRAENGAFERGAVADRGTWTGLAFGYATDGIGFTFVRIRLLTRVQVVMVIRVLI